MVIPFREQSLRVIESMHKILSMQVVFDCNVCNERFAALHPAYEPLDEVDSFVEILRSGKSGLSSCSMQVSSRDEIRNFANGEDLAAQHTGVCKRCRVDMNLQALEQEGVLGSVDNHMYPCFRSPYL